VLRFEVSKSVITVQREFRAGFRKDAPARNKMYVTGHNTKIMVLFTIPRERIR